MQILDNNNYDLTVAICVYNASKYIEKTLLCVLNQDFQKFDLIILNDCCTDDSMIRVKNFFLKHSRSHKIIEFNKNKGICYGRHYIESIVKTKYLIFIDSDDCPYVSLVGKLYNKIISDDDLMAVGCYLKYIDKDGNDIDGGIFIGETKKEDFYKKASAGKLIFMQPTAIYNREVALSVGGYTTKGFPEGKIRYQDFCEDLDLWTRMSDLYIKKKAIVIIPEVLCAYRKHDLSLSSNTFVMFLKMKYIKQNLILRRHSEREITFNDFLTKTSTKDYKKIIYKSKSADSFKKGYYQLKGKKYFLFLFFIIKSIWFNPKYIFEKINNNLIHYKNERTSY